MLKITFGQPPEGEHHNCESIRDGDWIIFYCPKCPVYQRKLNWRTGKMKSKGTNTEVYHSGSHFPAEYHEALGNMN